MREKWAKPPALNTRDGDGHDGGRRRSNGAVILRREWRELARFVLDGFVAGLVVSLVLALAVFIVTTPAQAATASQPAGASVPQGRRRRPRSPSPLVFTDVRMSVTGMIARVTVEQRFVNPTDEWREGVYVFPLPEKAAVDHLRMKVGERVIEGMIKERGEARRTYDDAKSEGRKATLARAGAAEHVHDQRRQHRPATRRSSSPSSTRKTLRYDDGTFRLRFPMAITPRYVPGEPTSLGDVGARRGGRRRRPHHAAGRRPRSEGYVQPGAHRRSTSTPASRCAKLSSTYHPMNDRGAAATIATA